MPLPVTSPFDPQYVLNTRLLSSFAVIAEPAALRHLHIQTFPMESSRTGFTAQQTASYKDIAKHTQMGYANIFSIGLVTKLIKPFYCL